MITPVELKKSLPLLNSSFIQESRTTLKKILSREDPRILLIIGPCSIHNSEEALHYASLLKELSDQVSDTAYILMRAYVEKPRTRFGWTGLIHDPKLDGSSGLEEGVYLTRKLLIDLAHLQIPVATEFLSPQLSPYFQDLISWGCIGARTCSSPIHRHLLLPTSLCLLALKIPARATSSAPSMPCS